MRFTPPQWRPSLARRRTPSRSAIEVSAFASVILALLALLMGPSFQVDFPVQIPVDMAHTNHSTPQQDARRDDALVIAVARDGEIYLANTRVRPAELSKLLQQSMRDRAQKTVYVKADARAKYSDIEVVLNQIRESGLQNVVFLTERPDR